MSVNIAVKWADNTPELVKNLKEGTKEVALTQASVDKLAQSLGGEKLITSARRMVAALEQMGGAGGALAGVEKLTNQERERTNALLDKAIQKYAALGKEAPAALRELELATRKAEDATKTMAPATDAWSKSVSALSGGLKSINGLLGGLGVSLSVGALVGFGKTLLSDADSLVRLSDKTEISIEWLQKFQVVTDDTGDSLESLAGAANKLQKNIGNNDPQAIEAIRQLGLNYEHIKSLKPEDQFIEIAGALQNVTDQNKQVALGTALMGRGFTEILPTIKQGFDDVKDAAVGMSDETARALDKMGDDIDAFWRRTKGKSATAFVAIKEELDATLDPGHFEEDVTAQLERMTKAAIKAGLVIREEGSKKLTPIQFGVGQVGAPALPADLLKNLEAVDALFGAQAENYKKQIAAAEAYRAKMEEVNKKIREATRDIGNLTDAQQEQVIALDNLGISNGDIAFKLGVSEVAVKRFIVAHDEMEAHIERLTQHIAAKAIPAFSGLILTWEQMLNTGKGLTVDGLIPLVKGFDDASRAELALKLYTDELTKSHVALQNQLAKTIGLMPDFSKMAKEHMAEFGTESGHGFSDAFVSVIDELPDAMRRAFEGGGGFEGAAKSLGIKFADDFIKAYADKMKAAGTPLTTAQNRAIGAGTAGGAALGAAVGGGTGGLVGGLASSIGGAGLAASGAFAGSVAGAVALGAATAGIGAAAVGVYALAKHFLTVSQNEKDARAEFQKLQSLYGSLPATIDAVGKAYEATGHTAEEAQAALKRALDATHKSAAEEQAALKPIAAILAQAEEKGKKVGTAFDALTEAGRLFGGTVPDAFKDAVRQLADMKGITEEQRKALLAMTKDVKPNFEQLTATAAKYGVTLEGLGKSFQQANIEGRAKAISGDFDALVKAGGDAGGILAGMSDEISALVSDSKKFGTAIPENMRPLIEELLRAGKLVDANGDALTDLAGLSFEDTPLDESIASLTDAIKELIAALTGVPVEIDKINKKPIKIPIETDPTAPPPVYGFLAGDQGNTSPWPSFANGSNGFQDFGIGTLAMLHGREAVVTQAQAMTVTNNSSSPRTVVMNEHLSFNVTLPPEGTQRPDYVEKTLMPEIMKQLEDHRRGYTGRMKRALS